MELFGRSINTSSLKFDGTPCFRTNRVYDLYWSYAEWSDGTPLTQDELQDLCEKHEVYDIEV